MGVKILSDIPVALRPGNESQKPRWAPKLYCRRTGNPYHLHPHGY